MSNISASSNTMIEGETKQATISCINYNENGQVGCAIEENASWSKLSKNELHIHSEKTYETFLLDLTKFPLSAEQKS